MGISLLQMTRVVVLQVAISVAAVSGVSAKEAARDLLATLRDQGYRCTKPISAQRDLARSKPDEAVWVLRCENDTYRIRFFSGMAARVERLN